jgi:hypothetical protein
MPLEDRFSQPVSVIVVWLSIVRPTLDEAYIEADLDIDIKDKLAFEIANATALTHKAPLLVEHAHHG